MYLSLMQQKLIFSALDNLADFVRLYGDDDSKDLLDLIGASFPQDNQPPNTVLIKISFSNTRNANIYTKYWRTHRFISSGKEGAIVELKTQGAMQYLRPSDISHIFESALIMRDSVFDFDDCDPMILSAIELLNQGAVFISASNDDTK